MQAQQLSLQSGNLLLDSLSEGALAALLPRMARVTLEHGKVIALPNEVTNCVYFPINCVISTVTRMQDGSAIEVGLTGHEGMAGLCYAFGSRTSFQTAVVQLPDSAWCIEAADFENVVARVSEIQTRVRAYAHYVFTAAAQFAACNRLHPVEERYARWLLMAQDRTGSAGIPLTQEFTAEMLGVRRAGVTVVAGKLSEAGLISTHRGHVTVLNRERLRAVACECYGVVNDALHAMLGFKLIEIP